VLIRSYAEVRDSILYDGVTVGRYARIRKAIIDKGVSIPEGMRIGYDADEDRRNGFSVSESGIVTVPRNSQLTAAKEINAPHFSKLEQFVRLHSPESNGAE
jgi:glucose-1-phosphate adenylyltransferase